MEEKTRIHLDLSSLEESPLLVEGQILLLTLRNKTKACVYVRKITFLQQVNGYSEVEFIGTILVNENLFTFMTKEYVIAYELLTIKDLPLLIGYPYISEQFDILLKG